jgi:hypothetical protein
MKHQHRARFLMFTLSVLLVSTGAAWPLNPLVTRSPRPPGAVPVECDQGLAPAPAPRLNVAEIPAPEVVPASLPAPPSRTLRRTLEDAHAALTRNDRPAFDAALTNARLIVRDYPPGAERTAAEEAVRAYDDAALLWDAQFASPFFDQNSEAYTRASRYPGYAEAVRRGVFTDDRDRRFYPAAESRTFVTRVASERLERLGIRTSAPPTRIARAERPTRSIASSSSSSSPSVSSAPPSAAPSTSRRTSPRRGATHTNSRKSATPAISTPASPDPPVSSARAVAESAPAAPPAAAPTPAAAPASPAAEGQPVDDVPDTPAPGTAPAGTAPDTASDTAPTTPASPDTAGSTVTPATPDVPDVTPTERRSLVIPALLIGIGLLVLVVLFRVSK